MVGKEKHFLGDVLNFDGARKNEIEKRKRSYERVLFRDFLGVYAKAEQEDLHAIEMIDISAGDMSFRVSQNSKMKWDKDDNINLRLYFSPDSYLPVSIKIVQAINSIEYGRAVRRYGAVIDKGTKSYKALFYFVKFISKFAEHGHKDSEQLKIHY